MSHELSRRSFLKWTGTAAAAAAAFGSEGRTVTEAEKGVAWAQGVQTYSLTYLEYATKGTFCLTGDACYWYQNAEKMLPLGYAQGNQVTQLFTIKKAKDIAGGVDRLVPGHDAQVFSRNPSRTVGKNRIAHLA